MIRDLLYFQLSLVWLAVVTAGFLFVLMQ